MEEVENVDRLASLAEIIRADIMTAAVPEDSGNTEAPQRHKDLPRPDEFQLDLQRRLNRAIGQLNGVKTMIDENRYCGDVLMQLAAAESAVRSVSSRILENHLETCVVEQISQGNAEVVGEVMHLIKRFAR